MNIPGYTDETPSVQEEFRSAFQRLMLQGKLQRRKKDDARAYEVIMGHQQTIKGILRLFNASLVTREEYGVLYVEMVETNDGIIRLAGGLYDQIVYLVLRREIELNRQQRIGDPMASITVAHLRDRVIKETTRLKVKPISETVFQTIIKGLKQEDVVEYRGSLKAGDTMINILPILLVLLSVERMENLSGYLQRAAQTGDLDGEDME
jgi:Domain of unknown function (DUF4194)